MDCVITNTMNLLVCMTRTRAKIFHHPCLRLCCRASFSPIVPHNSPGRRPNVADAVTGLHQLLVATTDKKINKNIRQRRHFLSLSTQ